MKLTTVESFLLFTLGRCHDKVQEQLSGKPLLLALQKSEFIRLAHRAGITNKKERTLYTTLQHLEEKRYVTYPQQRLALTSKGQRAYERIRKELQPYLSVVNIVEKENIMRYTEHKQTVLR